MKNRNLGPGYATRAAVEPPAEPPPPSPELSDTLRQALGQVISDERRRWRDELEAATETLRGQVVELTAKIETLTTLLTAGKSETTETTKAEVVELPKLVARSDDAA
jgi:hypothetical protein